MLDDKTNLEIFLARLNHQGEGIIIPNKNFYFTMFCFDPESRSFLELENRRPSTPPSIWLWKKDEKKLYYCLFSKNEEFPIISEYPGWHLSGGRVTPDNQTGSYFLSTPASNFGSNMEARLYESRNRNVCSIEPKKRRVFSL